MSWHEAISGQLPPPHEEESRDLRRDILDELADHLDCAMQRESLRTDDEQTARRNVLARFGDPARLACRLWLDAMKGTIMNQRILIGTNILLAAIVIAMFVIVLMQMQRAQTFQEAMIARLATMTAGTAGQSGEARPTGASLDPAALSWPSARVRIEGGNAPFELRFYGEPYNTGEKITLTEQNDGGETVFGPIRPGQYSLTVTDDYGASHQRSVVVPPGGEHEVVVDAPKWQPQPTQTRVRLDLPHNLSERLDITAVFLLDAQLDWTGDQWSHGRAGLVVNLHGRAASPEIATGWQDVRGGAASTPGNSRPRLYTARPGMSYVSWLDVKDFDLQERVTLDSSLHYRCDGFTLFHRVPEGQRGRRHLGHLSIPQEVFIAADAIASGDVQLSALLPDEVVEQLVALAEELEAEDADAVSDDQ